MYKHTYYIVAYTHHICSYEEVYTYYTVHSVGMVLS